MKRFLAKNNTLRNQIFMVISLVSIFTIICISALGYIKFSTFYKNSLDTQLTQTSIELNGAIDAKYQQVSTIASQVSTDNDIQKIMFHAQSKDSMTSNEQKKFKQILGRYYPYVDSIFDYRFYTLDGNAIYPTGKNIQTFISQEWTEQAIAAKGKLVWLGIDSKSNYYSYALKVIRLVEHNYSYSGFLVLRLKNDYFNTKFENGENFIQVYDASNNFITGQPSPSLLKNQTQHTVINKKNFHVVKSTSPTTGWTVIVAQSMASYNIELKSIKLFMFLLASISIFLAFGISWFISFYITKPLQQLISTMKKNPKQKLNYVTETNTSIEMYELHHTYNQFVIAIEQLIEEVYEKQLLQQHAELKALQSQIKPHFLYNTLNTFYWRLIEDDNERIANDILAMSELFKYSISTTSNSQEVVTLQDELHHLQNYLQLMKMRIGNRLNLFIDVDPKLYKLHIPKLLLQPLVENAIVHGIETQRDDSFISITIHSIDAQNIIVKIKNNGHKIPPQKLVELNDFSTPLESSHIGIQNIQLRLKLYYSEETAKSMLFESDDIQDTTITIILPKEIKNYDYTSITR